MLSPFIQSSLNSDQYTVELRSQFLFLMPFKFLLFFPLSIPSGIYRAYLKLLKIPIRRGACKNWYKNVCQLVLTSHKMVVFTTLQGVFKTCCQS